MREEYFVTEETAGDRIDKFLAEQYENLSRSFLQKLLKSGEVMVDGRPVKASYKVAEGDLISFEVPEAVEPEIVPEDIPLDILYEDHDVILVNKPKGMVVHYHVCQWWSSGCWTLYGDIGECADVSL